MFGILDFPLAVLGFFVAVFMIGFVGALGVSAAQWLTGKN